MSRTKVPRKHRHRRNYTFMIISGDSDGRTRKFHLNHLASQVLAYTVFLIALLLVCQIVYSVITIRTLKEIEAEQKEQIDELTAERSTLISSNNDLEKKVEQMSVALNQRIEEEQVSAVEAENNAIPSGFPLTGTPNYSKALDNPSQTKITQLTSDNKDTVTGNPVLVFESGAGNSVVASGSGTVLTVTPDVKFGYMVTIDHHNGYVSTYRSAGKPVVSEGASIDKGDIIFVIDSKNATVGFQIQKDEQYLDPLTIMEISG